MQGEFARELCSSICVQETIDFDES
jgi:hypothetical protein